MAQPDFTWLNEAGALSRVVFPASVAAGAASTIRFKTDVVMVDSGYENRNGRWRQPLLRVDAALGVDSLETLSALEHFFRLVYGKREAFLFEHPRDCQSSDPVSAAAQQMPAVTKDDQIIGTGDAIEVAFQLGKTYTVTDIDAVDATEFRPITKPQAATVLIALDGVLQGSGWTLDDDTGIVTFSAAPGSSVVVTAGFKYWIPMRFDTDEMSTNLRDYGTGSVSIPMVEVRGV